jgi:hypothetical protein
MSYQPYVLALALGSSLLGGCQLNNNDSAANCADDQQSVTTSDQRTLCVSVATKAQAPFMDGFYAARVSHVVAITDVDGNPIDITTDPVITDVSHHPMMTMNNGHEHTTPHSHEPDTSRAAQGIYTLTAYYIMASSMADGTPMGEWDYTVHITDSGASDTLDAHFTPDVKMVMGGNIFSAKGSNNADTWTDMMDVTKPRNYTVWLDAISANAGGGHDLALFVSTEDMMHMTGTMSHASFPSVYTGRSLFGPVPSGGGMQSSFTLDTVSVDISTDDGMNWQSLTEDGEGIFSGSGLSGFTGGSQVTLQVRVTVNGLEMQTAAAAYPQLIFTTPN